MDLKSGYLKSTEFLEDVMSKQSIANSIKYKIYGRYIPESRLASTEEEAIKTCESLNILEEIADGSR